ncbi:hypothetical protein [Hydrotalea sp.]|uniref:hypothetical protein n=1 Tax=Hydrotalea sp. TaxID=2881279 RepID=UPI00261E0E3E|nr:hypothetical protein [Hydrotalea sp.]
MSNLSRICRKEGGEEFFWVPGFGRWGIVGKDIFYGREEILFKTSISLRRNTFLRMNEKPYFSVLKTQLTK